MLQASQFGSEVLTAGWRLSTIVCRQSSLRAKKSARQGRLRKRHYLPPDGKISEQLERLLDDLTDRIRTPGVILHLSVSRGHTCGTNLRLGPRLGRRPDCNIQPSSDVTRTPVHLDKATHNASAPCPVLVYCEKDTRQSFC